MEEMTWLSSIPLIILTLIGISFFWTYFRGAPWVPSSMKLVHKMLQMAEVGPDDVVYDLGCGDGRTVIAAARRYGARAVGIEIAPTRYLWCRMLVALLGLGDRVTILYGDFFKHDLSGADVVTCYLLQDTNHKLVQKFADELKPGTRVVSNTFFFPDIFKVREDGDIRLYLFNYITDDKR